MDHGGPWFTTDSWQGMDGALAGCSSARKLAAVTRGEERRCRGSSPMAKMSRVGVYLGWRHGGLVARGVAN
jgi:hypothetical protein